MSGRLREKEISGTGICEIEENSSSRLEVSGNVSSSTCLVLGRVWWTGRWIRIDCDDIPSHTREHVTTGVWSFVRWV